MWIVGNDDHIRAVQSFRSLVDAPVLLHPDDRMLWDTFYPDQASDGTIADGESFTVGDTGGLVPLGGASGSRPPITLELGAFIML